MAGAAWLLVLNSFLYTRRIGTMYLANPSLGIDLACAAHAAANCTTSAGGVPTVTWRTSTLRPERRCAAIIPAAPFLLSGLGSAAGPSPAARRHLHWRPLLSCGTAFVLLIIGPLPLLTWRL
jgi:hypothetical protein